MQGCRDLLISLLDNIDGLPLELPLTCRKALATVQQVCVVCLSVVYVCVCVCGHVNKHVYTYGAMYVLIVSLKYTDHPCTHSIVLFFRQCLTFWTEMHRFYQPMLQALRYKCA